MSLKTRLARLEKQQPQDEDDGDWPIVDMDGNPYDPRVMLRVKMHIDGPMDWRERWPEILEQELSD